MVGQTISRALIGLALLKGLAQGVNIYVTNKCEESMTLAHVTPDGVSTDQVASGGTITKSFAPGTGSHVFKSGTGAQATLAEFSAEGGKCWLDISIIPTGEKSGPEYCPDLQACKDLTGGVGFNVPMQITPHTQDGARCIELTCMEDECPDAYQFPKDDNKTHTCPLSTDYDLSFCPGGSGGSTPATQSAPPPAPVSSPSPVPTPTPTYAPSPEQTWPMEQTSSLTTGPAASGGQEQQYRVQSSKSALSGSVVNAGDGTLRKVDAKSVQSSITQQKIETTDEATQQIGGQTPAAAANEDDVQQVNNRSEESSGNSTQYVVLIIGGCVGMIAAAAIVVVRKKKAQLDEFDSKTPLSAMPHGTLANFRTPRNNVSVL